MELLKVVLECDGGAVSRVWVRHPAARICCHERLDLLERVGIKEQTLVRPVGEVGWPLDAGAVVVSGRQRAEVRRDVLVCDAEFLHLRLIEPEIDEPTAEADLGAAHSPAGRGAPAMPTPADQAAARHCRDRSCRDATMG